MNDKVGNSIGVGDTVVYGSSRGLHELVVTDVGGGLVVGTNESGKVRDMPTENVVRIHRCDGETLDVDAVGQKLRYGDRIVIAQYRLQHVRYRAATYLGERDYKYQFAYEGETRIRHHKNTNRMIRVDSAAKSELLSL